jgi:hypothetical protein
MQVIRIRRDTVEVDGTAIAGEFHPPVTWRSFYLTYIPFRDLQSSLGVRSWRSSFALNGFAFASGSCPSSLGDLA